MAKGIARDPKKALAWRHRLEQQAGSGQSVRAWCREHGVTETAFYFWRRELARRDAEAQEGSFVSVHVADDAARDADSQIEILLADGRRVRITGLVHRRMLADVLDVLERRAC